MRDEILNTTGKKYLKSISDGEKRRKMMKVEQVVMEAFDDNAK